MTAILGENAGNLRESKTRYCETNNLCSANVIPLDGPCHWAFEVLSLSDWPPFNAGPAISPIIALSFASVNLQKRSSRFITIYLDQMGLHGYIWFDYG